MITEPTPEHISRVWIGVDLDGTLAVWDDTRDSLYQIGPPIPAMLARVKRWLAAGQDVRIFTARVGACGEQSPRALDDQGFADSQRTLVEAWCLEHIGQVLRVTATKDFQMIEYWDDRGVQVETNTGRRVDGQEG